MGRKLPIWIGLLVALLCVMAFWIFPLRGKANEHRGRLSELKGRRDSLEKQAKKGVDKTPNNLWVQGGIEDARKVEAELVNCEDILTKQRRQCHSRLFYIDPYSPRKEEYSTFFHWVERYYIDYEKVEDQFWEMDVLMSPGVFNFHKWAGELPMWEEIRVVQTEFWLSKDIANLVTNYAEKEIESLLKRHADPVLTSLLEVVRNPSPADLENVLRLLEQDELLAILSDILFNPGEETLEQVFMRHKLWQKVLELIQNDAQRGFVEFLKAYDRSDLVDHISDLRYVRYRGDLVGLYRNHENADLAKLLRKPTEENKKRIRGIISRWRETELAQAIASVVSIFDEKDLNVILKNHRVQVDSLGGFTIAPWGESLLDELAGGRAGRRPAGRLREGPRDRPIDREIRGGGPAAQLAGGRFEEAEALGMPGVYETIPFTLEVSMEFKHFPAFLRRLLSMDWRISVTAINVAKVGASLGRRAGVSRTGISPSLPRGRSRSSSGYSPRGLPGVRPDAGLSVPGREGALLIEEVPKYLVKINMTCEARRFYPLWKKKYGKEEEKNSGFPAPR